MISVIQSNAILNELRCSECQKYLSVLPIKVYVDKSIKCGRCVKNNDDGVTSFYCDLIEDAYFKCVNHYEGCAALLKPEDMVHHEKTCLSSMFECPICQDVQLPVYSMKNHFIKRHRKQMLQEQTLSLKFTHDAENYYFYEYNEDTVIIIQVCYDRNGEYISMNCIHMGCNNKYVTYDLHEVSSEKKIKSGQHLCTNKFIYNNKFINRVPINYLCTLKVNVCGTVYLNANNYNLEKLIPRNSTRVMHLSDAFMKDYPEWRLSPSGRILVNEDSFVTFQGFCYDCQYIRMATIETKCSIKVCKFCNDMKQQLIPMYNKLNFYCKLNCKQYFDRDSIWTHEANCSQRLLIHCVLCAGKYKLSNIVITSHDFNYIQHYSIDVDENAKHNVELFNIDSESIIKVNDKISDISKTYIKLKPIDKPTQL